MSKPPIGVLGGTFDPIHFGHLRLGLEAIDKLGLQSLRIIPVGLPPHRAATVASAAARLDMARLAIHGEARFTVDAGEVISPAVSYTVDTLGRLRAELGAGQSLCVIVGADAFTGLPRWSRWQQLFELAHIAVASRAGQSFDPDSLPAELRDEFAARYRDSPACLAAAPAGAVVRFAMTELAISASAIRELLKKGCSPRYLLPAPVLDYIASNRLYTKEQDGR
jgi:nicotinate-nucleotide adenylyltransferase